MSVPNNVKILQRYESVKIDVENVVKMEVPKSKVSKSIQTSFYNKRQAACQNWLVKTIVKPPEVVEKGLPRSHDSRWIMDSGPFRHMTEAVAAACYTLNRVFTVRKLGKTCFEILNRRKPNLKWLEPFGSTCTVLNPNGKFGPKYVEGFFVGLFDYESLWESFKLPEEDFSEVTLTMIYNQQLSENQVTMPDEPAFVPQNLPDHVQSDDVLESNPVFDDDGESDEEIIEAISPSTVATKVCENNLQPEVTVPTEVVSRTLSYHPEDNIIGDLNVGVEPKTYKEALTEESWVNAMQEELMQFEKLGLWKLVDLPEDKKHINTKWVFKCKRDENGIIVRNKARLVLSGFNQRYGIDYNEVYALVARLEAIWIFLAFASWKGFKVYQLNVKSAFLNGKISEEVYVGQPPGFWRFIMVKKAKTELRQRTGPHQN
ncbi:uncharacterized protein LOC143542734 [Bidens hawaiensis]|uniref:uncharacterized protein LOC143542734 n=1 Tax=Bidens hawaiensis TaxID=980011 RepID=UPI00404B0A1A